MARSYGDPALAQREFHQLRGIEPTARTSAAGRGLRPPFRGHNDLPTAAARTVGAACPVCVARLAHALATTSPGACGA